MIKKKSTSKVIIRKVKSDWTFFSNHSHVLLCLYRDPNIRLREVAVLVGITERAVISIVDDLIEARVIKRFREGRRNSYSIIDAVPLRHELESHRTVGELLKFIK
jgi:DNA-binding MarR family transcriptional regulator